VLHHGRGRLVGQPVPPEVEDKEAGREAEDQLGRLRGLLAGTGISFGMYVGKTPEKEADVAGIRLPKGASRADYEARLKAVRDENRSDTVYPPEEVCSREAMRRPGGQPRRHRHRCPHRPRRFPARAGLNQPLRTLP
jgi:hypothetical protein